MHNYKVCYNILFYLGDRRKPTKKYEEDRLFYLKQQIEYLITVPHNLSTIIFSFNIREEDYNFVSEIFSITPKKIAGVEVIIEFRPNLGMSYGAWSDTFGKYKTKFDYYIFNEDDYFFVENYWDTYLVNKYNSEPDCGYLCLAVRNPDAWNGYRKHAGHSAGIASAENLLKVWKKNGNMLPHNRNNPHFVNGEQDEAYRLGENSQIIFSFAFIELGLNVIDIFEDYKISFNVPYDEYDIWYLYYWNEKSLAEPAFILFESNYKWYTIDELEFDKEFVYSTAEEALACYNEKKSLGALRNV